MDAYLIVNILCCLLILTSLLVVIVKSPKTAAYIYAAQSLVLIGCFVALGFATESSELFVWAGTGFVTKVILVPAIILFALKKISSDGASIGEELKPVMDKVVLVILVAVEVAVCFFIVQGVNLPTAADVKPALGISLAHFFIGVTCITTQRNIVKQVFGYCLMENGSHLTLALLAPSAPHLVEIGITTDAIFAVIIMAIMVVRIRRTLGTLNADELMNLRG